MRHSEKIYKVLNAQRMRHQAGFIYIDYEGRLMGVYLFGNEPYEIGGVGGNNLKYPVIDICLRYHQDHAIAFVTHPKGVSFCQFFVRRRGAGYRDKAYIGDVTGSLCLWHGDKIWLVTDSDKSITIITVPNMQNNNNSPLKSIQNEIKFTTKITFGNRLQPNEKIIKMCMLSRHTAVVLTNKGQCFNCTKTGEAELIGEPVSDIAGNGEYYALFHKDKNEIVCYSSRNARGSSIIRPAGRVEISRIVSSRLEFIVNNQLYFFELSGNSGVATPNTSITTDKIFAFCHFEYDSSYYISLNGTLITQQHATGGICTWVEYKNIVMEDSGYLDLMARARFTKDQIIAGNDDLPGQNPGMLRIGRNNVPKWLLCN